MSNQLYLRDFEDETSRQVTHRAYLVDNVSQRLGVSANSLSMYVKAVRPYIAEITRKTCSQNFRVIHFRSTGAIL